MPVMMTGVDVEELVRLRNNGWSFTDLGRRYGVSRQRAHEMYHRAVANMHNARIEPLARIEPNPDQRAARIAAMWLSAVNRNGVTLPNDYVTATLADADAPRDDRVAALLLEGRTNKEVGAVIGISAQRVSLIWDRWLKRRVNAAAMPADAVGVRDGAE